MKNQVKKEEDSSPGEKRGYKLSSNKRSYKWIILLGLLLASQSGTAKSASSSWSMFQHDPQHSGRSNDIGIKQPIPKWSYFANSYIFASPVIDSLERIYLVSEDGNLHIISASGKKEKIISIGDRSDSTPAVSKEGNIYVALNKGQVLCFNSEFKNQWVYPTKSAIKTSSPAINQEGTIFIGCEDGTLHAINKDGNPKWICQTSSRILSSPAISDDGIIYIGCEDGSLYAINSDGSLRFKKEIGISTFSSPVIDSDGNVYIGCSNRVIKVITKDGNDLLSIPLESPIYSSPVIARDGSIFIGSEEGLYGITSVGVWCAKIGRIFNSTPAISLDGVVYVASFEGKIYAVDPQTGGLIWSYDIGLGPTSLAIDKDTIYVGTRDRNLYAIGSKLTPTPKKPELPKVVVVKEKEVKAVEKPPEVVVPKEKEIKAPKVVTKEEKEGIEEVEEKVKITPPASPSNLVVTPVSDKEVMLVWEDNADNEDGYKIYRRTKDEKEYFLIKILLANSTSFLDTTLIPATTYFYRVVAYNKMGFCEYSVQAEITTKPPLPPEPPSDLKVDVVSSTQITISWSDNSDNEQGFQLERKLSGGEYCLIKTLSANTTTFQDIILTPATTYSYRLVAYNEGGNSMYSNEITITTKGEVPSAPKDLQVTYLSTSTISFKWVDTSNNEQGFKVERDQTLIKTLPPDSTSFRDTNLKPGNSYSYRALSFNESGNSDYSNEVNVALKSLPPQPPLNLKAKEILAHKVTLVWQDNSDNEAGFKIERKTLDGKYAQISLLPVNTTTLEDISVTPLTTYFYRIAAYNEAGLSDYSKEIQIRTTDEPPAPPTDLQISAISQSCNKLTWSDNSDNEQGFKIERALPLGEYVQIKVLPPNTTSYVDEGLKKDTAYYYRLRAYNKLADSEYSNVAGIRTLDVLPSPPSNLRGVSNMSTQIKLFWQDNSKNEAGYRIERRLKSEADYTQIAIVSKDITQYEDNDLIPGTTYCYRVKAYNRVGSSEHSNILSMTTLPVLPFVPTNLKSNPISSNQINLSWTDNSNNESGFRIERKTEGKNYEEIYILGANVTTYEDKYLEPNTTYYYRIRAYNQTGNSSYSNEQEATTKDILPYPPSNLWAKPTSTTQIDLSWQDNSKNEQGFKLERSPDGEVYTTIATLLANTTTYQDKDLLPNTTYYYRLKAYNSLGDSYYSNKVDCKTLDIIPSVPTNLRALFLPPDKVNLRWQDNSGNESGFKIERKEKDNPYTQIATVLKDITTYQDTGLLPKVIYTYRIQAYNEEGNSEYSNETVVKTYQETPHPPTNLTAKPVSHNEIKLTWQDKSANELGFKIERKVSNEKEFTQISITSVDTTSYQDGQLAPATPYYYCVKAYNETGDSDYSNMTMAVTHPAPASKIQPMITGKSPYSGIDSPKISWTYMTKGRINRSNPIIDANERIYIGSEDGHLYCVSASGKLLWDYATPGAITTSPAIGEDGEIYVVSADQNLYALLPDGTLKWKYPIKFPSEVSPVIAPNFAIQVFTENGKVYSIHPDGRLRWTGYIGGGKINHTPVIDAQGNIYIGAGGIDGGLFCLDSKGTLKWKDTDDGEATTPPSLDSNGNVYIGLNNTLYSFNPQGRIRFKIEQGKGSWMNFAPIIASDGVIYYNISRISQKGNLIAAGQDGKILWTYPLGWSELSPIIDVAENIYAISKDYNLSCLSSEGELKWNYTFDSKITTSPNIGKDGTIYVGANNGQLYALRKGDKLPPNAPCNLVAEAVSHSQINLNWTDSSKDELLFIIERAAPDESYSQLAELPFNTTSYQDRDLVPLTTYYYRIKTVNKNGSSEYCNHAYARTLKLPPPLLTEVSIIPLKGGGKLKLTWQKPKEDAFSFSHVQIYRSIVKGTLGTSIADGIKETTYVDTDLVNDLAYYYTFIVFDIYGNKSVPVVQYVGVPRDNILPQVISCTPTGNNVPTEAPITITFNERMDNESVIQAFSISPAVIGTFTWEWNKLVFKPLSDLTGNTKYTVSISTQARDISGNYLEKPFTHQFTVYNPSPIIWSYSPINLSPTVNEGESLLFEANVSDPNGDEIRYSWKLNGVEKSKDSSWTYTPGNTDAGPKTLILTVSDGVSAVLQNWTIKVIDKNMPPVLSAIKDMTINVDELLQFNVSAFDPDGDALTYTASSLPKGANFSSKTKIFSWRPTTKEQGGSYQIIFKVSDGKGGEDSKKVKINVNLPPVIE